MKLEEINRETKEGKLLMAAMSIITANINYINTFTKCFDEVVELSKTLYGSEHFKTEEKSIKKFEAGAKAKVIGNSNMHSFKIGEEVKLSEFSEKNNEWKCFNKDDWWWVLESELELI